MSEMDTRSPHAGATERAKRSDASFLRDLLLARTQSSVVTQAFRFMIVGALATVVDVSILYVLASRVGLDYRIAAAFAFIAGSVVSYLFSIKWVFTSRAVSNRAMEFSIFTVIGAIGLGLTVLIMHSFVTFFGLHYMVGKAVAIVTVFSWNFGARRFVLFR